MNVYGCISTSLLGQVPLSVRHRSAVIHGCARGGARQTGGRATGTFQPPALASGPGIELGGDALPGQPAVVDDMFRIVTVGWAQLLLPLRAYLERGVRKPFFDF
jgi:hypothetical protein